MPLVSSSLCWNGCASSGASPFIDKRRRQTGTRILSKSISLLDDQPLIAAIASDAVLEQAYVWLCARRKDYASDADVGHLRWL